MFRPPSPANLTLNLAPMVDVMMCLIIFFLLASKLVDAEHYPVNLPWAAAAREVETKDLGNRVTINVRQTGPEGRAAEFVVVDWDGRQILERVLGPEQLDGLLRSRAARAVEQNETLRCVIRADEDVQYQHVETVLRACGRTQISDIVFSANKLEHAAYQSRDREGAGRSSIGQPGGGR